ncbi:hypothetical protein [Lignipirellula cremea]|nr:hypothetical protein [Lignipirellula cremea]
MAASLLIVLATVIGADAAEPLRLAGIFADHMVLQREQPIPVWGWANKDATVKADFAGQRAETKAAADGSWSVALKPLAANSKEASLQVESGSETVVIRDVLVGEVWHASGQSNMAMNVGAMARELKNVNADIAAADLPSLRFCRINEPESAQPLIDLPNPHPRRRRRLASAGR